MLLMQKDSFQTVRTIFTPPCESDLSSFPTLGWVLLQILRFTAEFESSCSDHLLSLRFPTLGVNRLQISLGNKHFPVKALPFTFSEAVLEYKLPRERDFGPLYHLCIPIAKLRAR